MDKSWMGRSRLSKEYEWGVKMFIKFGERYANGSTGIRCPCLKCVNCKLRTSQEIRDHLYIYGIDRSYKTWFWHGEDLSNDVMDEEVGDNMDESMDNKNSVCDMDKSWMGKSLLSKEYDLGVEMFIKFGERHAKGSTSIRCPCKKCKNRKFHSSEDIRAHMYFHGIDQSYRTWFWHGEKLSNEFKVKDAGDIMDKSLDKQNKDYDLKDIMETDKAVHTTNPLMSDYNVNISNTSHIKFDCDKRKTRGATTTPEITRCSSQGDRKVVQYNDYGKQIGVNAAKLRSYIGSCVHHHVPITYASWKHVPNAIKEKIFKLIQAGFVIDEKAKKSILQNAGNSFRQFKSRLTTHYIIPFKDHPDRLENPPEVYSHIERHHWHQFVKSRLSEEFENIRTLQAQRRAKNKYNYRSRKGYANLFEEMKKKYSIEKATQMNIKTEKENIEAEEEDESSKDVSTKPKVAMNPSCDYVPTRTSGKPKCSDQPKGEGDSSKPSAGFDTLESGPELERMQKNETDEMVKALHPRVEELEEKIRQQSQFPPNSERSSCNEQHSEDEVLGPVKNSNLEKDN